MLYRQRRIQLVLHLEDVESFATGTRSKTGCLLVTEDLLGLGIPFDVSSQPGCDCAEVTGIEHLDMSEDVGDRQAAFANTAVEVLFVALVWFSFVETHDVFVGVLAVVPFFFDGCAGDLATVDKDAPFRALESDAVVPATFHNHFDTAGEFAADREVMRGVVTVVARCETIFVGNGVLGICAIDLDRPHARFVLAERPSGDIDVVSSPVGNHAA